jgi:hypothetical protein
VADLPERDAPAVQSAEGDALSSLIPEYVSVEVAP